MILVVALCYNVTFKAAVTLILDKSCDVIYSSNGLFLICLVFDWFTRYIIYLLSGFFICFEFWTCD